MTTAAEDMDWFDNEMVHYVSDEYMESFRNTKKPTFVAFTCPYTADSYVLFFSYTGFFR